MSTTMSDNMLALIRAVAENNFSDAKRAAIACCCEDESKRNAMRTEQYKKMLDKHDFTEINIPFQIKGILQIYPPEKFNANRYYCSEKRTSLLHEIQNSEKVSAKLLELGIPYLNSTMLYGDPGTGKTEFGKYVAYMLGIPFAYINFSQLIDSYMGKTSQNVKAVFDFCKMEKCVLLLDEIDCIGLKRGKGSSGPDSELARTTITLMQCLDELTEGQIIIGATNRADRLDAALLRRFQRVIEFKRYNAVEMLQLATKYLNDVGLKYDEESLENYVSGLSSLTTQADLIKTINSRIVEAITENKEIDFRHLEALWH